MLTTHQTRAAITGAIRHAQANSPWWIPFFQAALRWLLEHLQDLLPQALAEAQASGAELDPEARIVASRAKGA